ncbi:MAG TPA: porin, partial [Bacteroidia bacterium]|nr:porin [Bacteroidia bacterium]
MEKIWAFLFIVYVSTFSWGAAQTDSTKGSLLTFSGYLEAYYAFDLSNPDDHRRPFHMYSHDRHNEFAINLAMVKVNYSKKRTHANLGLMAGTYANSNLATEPLALRYLYEANIGLKISKSRNLWLDCGIFPSHIGLETAIGRENWTLSRSMAADNSPYYESGLKVSYNSANEKWLFCGLILNGWQRMARPIGNNTPAFGHQVTWKPNAKTLLNSSSFVGNNQPDSLAQMRYFHDFYIVSQISKRFAATLGFDIGMQQTFRGSGEYDLWYSPFAILRAQLSKRLALAARGEYLQDAHGVILDTGTPNGFQTLGYSLNADVAILENV